MLPLHEAWLLCLSLAEVLALVSINCAYFFLLLFLTLLKANEKLLRLKIGQYLKLLGATICHWPYYWQFMPNGPLEVELSKESEETYANQPGGATSFSCSYFS